MISSAQCRYDSAIIKKIPRRPKWKRVQEQDQLVWEHAVLLLLQRFRYCFLNTLYSDSIDVNAFFWSMLVYVVEIVLNVNCCLRAWCYHCCSATTGDQTRVRLNRFVLSASPGQSDQMRVQLNHFVFDTHRSILKLVKDISKWRQSRRWDELTIVQEHQTYIRLTSVRHHHRTRRKE